jgi:flagellar protein FliO/FliZ
MQADYLQIVTVLAFIVGLIFLMAWFARRLTTGRTLDANAIAVIATRFLGPKEKLLLVEVEGTRVLIGINAQSMTPLCTIPHGQPNRLHPDQTQFSTALAQAELAGGPVTHTGAAA